MTGIRLQYRVRNPLSYPLYLRGPGGQQPGPLLQTFGMALGHVHWRYRCQRWPIDQRKAHDTYSDSRRHLPKLAHHSHPLSFWLLPLSWDRLRSIAYAVQIVAG